MADRAIARESRWHDAGLGRRWHYYQYVVGDRIFGRFRGRQIAGTVAIAPGPDAIMRVYWDNDKVTMRDFAAYNAVPVAQLITEDPL